MERTRTGTVPFPVLEEILQKYWEMSTYNHFPTFEKEASVVPIGAKPLER